MTDAVVWDMGGIMFRYFTELMLEIGVERGWPMEGIACGPTGPVRDSDYVDMVEGHIQEHDYLDIVMARLRGVGIAFDPQRELDWPANTRPETWSAIQRIHESGVPQGLLTNDASNWLGDRWWDTWEPARWFEAMVDVATIGVRKPNPEPYLAVADALGVDARGCIFVDDLRVNCRGAEAVGMQSHWFDIVEPHAVVDRLTLRLGLGAG